MATTWRPTLLAALAALLLCSSLLASPVLADEGADEAEDDYEDEERAFLLVKKSVVEDQIVQGETFTIKLDFYNPGENDAKNIKINDPVLPPELELVSGSLTGSIAKIEKGKSATFSYQIKSNSAGQYVAPPCSITYQADSDAESLQETVSTIFVTPILSPTQKNMQAALKAGSYLSLGLLNSPDDWRNSALFMSAIAALVGGNYMVTKFTQSSADRRRQRALDELEQSN